MKPRKNQSEDIDSIYKATLLKHRDTIINNKYARELETKYNKSHQKSYTFTPKKSPNFTHVNTHLWPVHNRMFIKVLKSKLDDVLIPTISRRKENIDINAKLSFEKIRKVLRTSNGRIRNDKGRHELKDLDLLAVDFGGPPFPRRPKGSLPKPRPLTTSARHTHRKEVKQQKAKTNISPIKIGLNFTYIDDAKESSVDNLDNDTLRDKEEFRMLHQPRYYND
ncbi:unnamed protein product [Blepharisma stoltei]|uniref:Uncharacterized protein n=1 Tax=Blepharisma stoltei TaxID=1481888 RepID=A0AAU9JP42_9CILI|nr:unnamed protein product [Blepharisma stoltei]